MQGPGDVLASPWSAKVSTGGAGGACGLARWAGARSAAGTRRAPWTNGVRLRAHPAYTICELYAGVVLVLPGNVADTL